MYNTRQMKRSYVFHIRLTIIITENDFNLMESLYKKSKLLIEFSVLKVLLIKA